MPLIPVSCLGPSGLDQLGHNLPAEVQTDRQHLDPEQQTAINRSLALFDAELPFEPEFTL